jgi:hypothetical protein
MSQERDEFQVTLLSNVKSNPRNKPAEFETQLAKPLDLPGEWDVALIELCYPHNFRNLKNYLFVGLFTELAENEERPARTTLPQAIVMEDTLRDPRALPNYVLRRGLTIMPGNYTANDIAKRVQALLEEDNVMKLQDPEFTFNAQTQKVEAYANKRFALASIESHSLLHVLGFSREADKMETDAPENTVEYLVFEASTWKAAGQCPILQPLSSMFVYTDITDYVLVGDTQAPLLGYVPIMSKYGEQADWCLNPVYYVHVNSKQISNISIRICTDTGETFPFEEGKVICRLNFKQRNYLR